MVHHWTVAQLTGPLFYSQDSWPPSVNDCFVLLAIISVSPADAPEMPVLRGE